VFAIGSDRDQFFVTRAAQRFLLTSVYKEAGPAFFDLLRVLENDGRHEGHYQGRLELAPFHLLESEVPLPIQTDLAVLRAKLEQGLVQTGVPPEAP
jgi:hypothetical protein